MAAIRMTLCPKCKTIQKAGQPCPLCKCPVEPTSDTECPELPEHRVQDRRQQHERRITGKDFLNKE